MPAFFYFSGQKVGRGKKTSSWQKILKNTFLHLNFKMVPLGIKITLFTLGGKPLVQKMLFLYPLAPF